MNPAIKRIGKEFIYSYQSKKANQELAMDISTFIKDSIPFLQEEAKHSLKISSDDSETKDFIDNYVANLSQLMFYIKSSIVNLFDKEAIEGIIFSELSYLYKNLQMIYAQKHNVSTDFVISSSCCDICKFLADRPECLAYHFAHDDCDSYLQLRPEFVETSNIISKNFIIRHVPTKYKNNIESCIKRSLIDYPMFLKHSLSLTYFQSPLEYDKDEDVVSFYQNNTIYQQFNLYSYQEDLLRHLVDVKENELTKKIFYSKHKLKKSSPASHFINLLAEQNSFAYLRESLVAYILHKGDLYKKDEEIYNFLEERLN